MAGLRVELLGPPRAEIGGAPLKVDTRKAIALPAYLACSGRRHGRDELAALLWPEADEAHARAALRRTLSALNHALAAGPGGASVRADRVGLELDAPGLDLDLRRFRELVAGCAAHGHDPERGCAACVAPLAEAVALHRGEFMAGFALRDAPGFEDWQLAEAGSCRRELAVALRRLVGTYAGRGAWDAAIAEAGRWLALDPLHEPAHRQLMRLYAWSGQRGAAMNAYRACVRVLDEELGVPPLEETTDLYRAVVEDRVEPPPATAPAATAATAATAAAEPPEASAGAAAAGAPPAAAAVPMVGRDAQLAILLGAYDEAGRLGRGRIVALTGEAGIGKTRLAGEVAARVVAGGGQVLACRCYEDERLAYGPLVDALRAAVAGPRGPAWAREVAPHWLAEAARLLPELAPLVAGHAPPSRTGGAGAQGRLLEGLCRTLLAAAAGPRPGLLVLDDLQWADEATLDAVGYLFRRLRGPLLVVAAWRGEQVPRGHRLRRLLAEARRAGAADLLELERLDRASVAELVGSVAPGRAGVAAALHERTEGLPLLVVEYLAVLDLDDPAAALPDLPGGARDLLQARLEQVPEAAWQVLTAAAAIGRSFDADAVREASGRSEEETVGALEELVRLGLVREPAGEPGAYDFGHEQLRVLVYGQAGLARRRLLHQRIAHGIAAQARADGSAAQAATIARHLQLAGRDADAAEWFARAGERAAAVYANHEAVAHLRAALALGHPDPAKLQLALGDLHTLLGAYDAALAAYEAAAARAEPGGPAAFLAGVEHRLGGLHHRRGDWDAADAHHQAALAALEGEAAGPEVTAARARLVADRSLTAHRRGDLAGAGRLAARALDLAEAAEDPASLAQGHNLLGVLATRAGDDERARDHLERSLALAATLPDPGVRVAALNNLALAHRAAGRLDEAFALTETALDLCTAQGDRHRQAALHNNLADLLHAAGRSEEAMKHLKQAVTIFAEVGEPGRLEPAIWQLVEW